MNTVAIVPARFASTRLPGKALMEIAGKPMVCWVAERARSARNVNRVIVATDSEQIRETAEAHGIEAVMTSADHASGTDRIAEVAAKLTNVDIVVNLQGDEPLISPLTIERAITTLIEEPLSGAGIVTTWEHIETQGELLNSDVVKVIIDDNGYALYFSRSPIPFPRDAALRHGGPGMALDVEPGLLEIFKKHTGLYVYRGSVLLEFANCAQTTLERIEGLEQLRALQNGMKIKAIEASSSSIGVDTADDLRTVREQIELLTVR
ncbi:MAG: 3-deoxy-manno-octulosonate cytidylyltransferase [Pyrinomonadaceae bacterium]